MEIEEESAERIYFLKSSVTSALSIDSLEANGMVASEFNPSVLRLGLDILEEQCHSYRGRYVINPGSDVICRVSDAMKAYTVGVMSYTMDMML